MDQFTVWTAEASGTCGKIRVPVGREKKKVAEIMYCTVHNDHTNRFSVRLDLPISSYKTYSSSTLLINTKSSLSLTL